MMRFSFSLLLTLFAAPLAHAACSNPEGDAGRVIYNTTYKVMQYCNGTNWINTGAVIANAAQGGCSNPEGQGGRVIFNASQGVVQFCNGSNWVDTACARDRKKNGSGCTGGGKAGTIRYVGGSVNELQFCDSTDWVAMGWPCGSMGLVDWSQVQQTYRLSSLDGVLSDEFGNEISYYGDTLLVGAYLKNNWRGAAYVFVKSGGLWIQQATLVPSDAENDDYFGFSVSIYGDTALVGAYGKNNRQGAVYVFVRNGTSWSQQAKLVASDVQNGWHFGSSVAITGDTALIGAQGDSKYAGNEKGSAYIFTRIGTNWTEQIKLVASDGSDADLFGKSVSLSGNTALIGAPDNDNGRGAAYVFTGSGNNWVEQAKLTAADAQYYASFGYKVTLENNLAAIGSPFHNSSRGAVYIFTGAGNNWVQQSKLVAADAAANDKFGESVSLSGSVALIGASGDDDGASNTGSAYVFKRNDVNFWDQQNKITASDRAQDDYFGSSVAASSNKLMVGAPGDVSGSVYIFEPSN